MPCFLIDRVRVADVKMQCPRAQMPSSAHLPSNGAQGFSKKWQILGLRPGRLWLSLKYLSVLERKEVEEAPSDHVKDV